jgi:hypothetical protein
MLSLRRCRELLGANVQIDDHALEELREQVIALADVLVEMRLRQERGRQRAGQTSTVTGREDCRNDGEAIRKYKGGQARGAAEHGLWSDRLKSLDGERNHLLPRLH